MAAEPVLAKTRAEAAEAEAADETPAEEADLAPELVAVRRAVEALRSGVPSWDAVALLGSGQNAADDAFTALLARTAARAGADASEQRGSEQRSSERRGKAAAQRGLLLGGGFGGGKSHLLTHFGHLAMAEGFVTSTVVISKETPLHDPVKTFRAAIDAAVDPDRRHGALASAAALLNPASPRYVEFSDWVNSKESGLDERFAATLLCHERLRGGELPGSEETADGIVRFWGGEPIRLTDLNRALKAVGAKGMFKFTRVSVKDLAQQRFRFASALMRAAGHQGWIIAFDEVELIGRYSLLQRARSYAELGRWLVQKDGMTRDVPLAAVFAMTDDFEAAVLTGKKDKQLLPQRLRNKRTAEWDETAGKAVEGMRRIESDMLLLQQPGAGELDRIYEALKAMHADAYQWDPPDVAGLERLGTTRMRQYVRAWINEWDLIRIDPDFEPDSQAIDIESDYTEDTDLEHSSDGDSDSDSDNPGTNAVA